MKSMDNKILRIMELSLKYIGKLKEEEMDKLLSGEYSLVAIEVNKKNITKEVNNNNNNWCNQISALMKTASRDEATTYIKSLKLTNDKLISLGQALGIAISKGTKKEKIISNIVEITIGDRLKVDGLRRGIIK